MSSFNFTILKKSKKSLARLGILKTPHGEIKTPAFVAVGTKATVKSLTPEDLDQINSQMVFINTYHTVLSPGIKIIQKAGGIHKFSGIKVPIITDSGGFQVFSLTRPSPVQRDEAGTCDQKRKVIFLQSEGENTASLVKITNDGVEFRSPIDGKKLFFTPEFSIEAQREIGGDLMVAFDECTYYGASYKYTKKAMERTHEWAKRSLAASKSKVVLRQVQNDTEQSLGIKSQKSEVKEQKLFGVIQGGLFEDLRRQSAKFIASLPFFGIAIGGVSVGETKKEMRDQVYWVMDVVADDKRPIHLLGVGEIDDIFDMVKIGVDTMDCVVPTRHARMGKLYKYQISNIKYQKHISNIKNIKEIDIFKSVYKGDLNPIDKNCQCYTCQHFTRAYLHHLFKQRELLGYRLATIHNLYFFERLFERIRNLIENNQF
jgi:tRNA-guanine transglycosylase